MKLEDLPGRVFLDTCVVNLILDFGEQIHEGVAKPDGLNERNAGDIDALCNIFLVGQRAHWQLAVSPHTYQEVIGTANPHRRRTLENWFFELWQYWRDIIDPDTGNVVAGVRTAENTLADARLLLRAGPPPQQPRPGENTTIGLVATNARLTKAEVNRMALMADDGFARAIFPSHTLGDGDTVFSLATGKWTGTPNITQIGALAADVMAKAIVRAATEATGLPNLPAARDLAKR